MYQINFDSPVHVHFIGIGGISMSGLAEVLLQEGFTISGSDSQRSELTRHLEEKGATVFYGQTADNIKPGIDVVVYTAAIHPDNAEFAAARSAGIPMLTRAELLGEIMRNYKTAIAVAGTHGKTTTTSMISLCFMEAVKDPSIQVGAYLKQLDGNYRIGNSEHFIIEACEYVESFLKFSPKAEVILNIDNDHLDYFKTFENIKNAFIKYTKLLPSDGLLVVNGDDKNCLDLYKYTDAKKISYSILNKEADFYADNISFNDDGFPTFDVYKLGDFFENISLSVPGRHNVLNALACIALCDFYGIGKDSIKSALSKFTGAHRRFEFKGIVNGARVFDDYGHHPTEIVATANSLKNKKYNESWVVFQPHTYSRTKNLLDDFANALTNFDHVIVLDIYAARESNVFNISSQDLVDKINLLGKHALYISDFENCVSYVKENVKENDIILTLGAGTVTEIGPMLLEI